MKCNNKIESIRKILSHAIKLAPSKKRLIFALNQKIETSPTIINFFSWCVSFASLSTFSKLHAWTWWDWFYCKQVDQNTACPTSIHRSERLIHWKWWIKIWGKWKINWNYNLLERSKLIYVDSRVKRKSLQHLESCQNSTLSITLMASMTSSIISKIYLATVIKKSTLWRNFESWKRRLANLLNFILRLVNWRLIMSILQKYSFEN